MRTDKFLLVILVVLLVSLVPMYWVTKKHDQPATVSTISPEIRQELDKLATEAWKLDPSYQERNIAILAQSKGDDPSAGKMYGVYESSMQLKTRYESIGKNVRPELRITISDVIRKNAEKASRIGYSEMEAGAIPEYFIDGVKQQPTTTVQLFAYLINLHKPAGIDAKVIKQVIRKAFLKAIREEVAECLKAPYEKCPAILTKKGREWEMTPAEIGFPPNVIKANNLQ